MNNKRWVYQNPDQEMVKAISHKFGVSSLAASVAYNRGIRSSEEIETFFEKDISKMHDPFLMKDMDKAVARIEQALRDNETIIVYGDYDVDGVTATTILVKYLRTQTENVGYYIPDRVEEGYGINIEALEAIKQSGANLVITVDSGITAIDEIAYANQIGLDVIVTDHHECQDIIPQCQGVLNPKQLDCNYPFKSLAGVGVAFKLIHALAGHDKLDYIIRDYCDIVCLGTIADVVPLQGENRLIVDRGLKNMWDTLNIGLKSLIQVSCLNDNKITTGTVGFILAPRINAAGRVGSASRAVELFLTQDEDIAKEISNELNEENKNRQATETDILREALEIVERDYDLQEKKILVLAGENWHHGVIGIVASRITDRFYRPSIMISLDEEKGKGSGRSIPGFNLFEALERCKSDLLKFGGHELAAGLSIQKDKIHDFIENINKYADENLDADDLTPMIKIDCRIDIENLNIDIVKELSILEPFGMGNSNPIFCLNNAKIADIRTVGGEKHLKVLIEKDDHFIDAIGFNMGEYIGSFIKGDIVDVAGALEINSYKSNEKIQLLLKDIKLTDDQVDRYKYFEKLYGYINGKHCDDFVIDEYDGEEFEHIIPERQDFIIVYQYIRSRSIDNVYIDDEILLHRRIERSYGRPMNYLKLMNCLDVFMEMELLDYSICENKVEIRLYEKRDKKVNIEHSKKLIELKKIKNNMKKG